MTQNVGQVNRFAQVKAGIFQLSSFYIVGKGYKCELEVSQGSSGPVCKTWLEQSI